MLIFKIFETYKCMSSFGYIFEGLEERTEFKLY